MTHFLNVSGSVHLLVHRLHHVPPLRLLLLAARVQLLRWTAPGHERTEHLLPGTKPIIFGPFLIFGPF